MLGPALEVLPVACLADNYAYLVWRLPEWDALVIDPSEAQPLIRQMARLELRPVGLLCTHHHGDHVGGVTELLEHFGALPVFGYTGGRIPGLSRELGDAESFELAGMQVTALHVPGHTLDALTYVVGDAAFTGDTLFCAGCGRLFEGTPDQMYESLTRLASLPAATRVFCGHEYTANNLEFAHSIEPKNEAVAARRNQVRSKRARGEPTVGATMALERTTNPFLRCGDGALRAALGVTESMPPADVLAMLRRKKDHFRA